MKWILKRKEEEEEEEEEEERPGMAEHLAGEDAQRAEGERERALITS